MVPKKKKGKQAQELTTDEVMKRLFPKEILKELKKIARGEIQKKNKKTK